MTSLAIRMEGVENDCDKPWALTHLEKRVASVVARTGQDIHSLNTSLFAKDVLLTDNRSTPNTKPRQRYDCSKNDLFAKAPWKNRFLVPATVEPRHVCELAPERVVASDHST